jgi:phospholipase C
MKIQTTTALAAASAAVLVCVSAFGQPGGLTNVQHVVIFMQENRSFDHYFGTLKGVRGFDDPNALLFQSGQTDFYQPQGSSYVLPFHSGEQCVVDLDHSWYPTHAAWDTGKWDVWIASKSATCMAYYDRADLSYYYALAEAYTVCDAYFCSVFGPTNPNRLYLWTGMIDPNGTGGGPVIDNSEPGFTWTTYPERLQAAGVSWKVYQQPDNFDDNALAWFTQYRNASPGNPLYGRGMAMVSDLVTAFRTDVTNGTLPKVSWLIAPTALSEHPVASPASGELLTKQLLDALASSPTVFNSTVFILTYDENDGFFDHVPPPVPPTGTANEFVNGLPIGLGVRVPAIVISPWSRGGYVCSQVFDHTSIIRFLETWTGVMEPNISAWRRAICGDLTSAFNFSHPDYSYPSLPVPSAVNCPGGVTPPVPSPQTVPAQESGTLLARPLPYQLSASSYTDCSLGRFYITLTNAGPAAGHVAIYPNAFRNDRPWQYDVPPNGSVGDYFSVALFGGGKYDLSAYGPNGFLRRFSGNINTACNQIEVSSSLDPVAGGIQLTLRNSTGGSVAFTVTANAYQAGGPWTYSLSAGTTVSNTFLDLTTTLGWYDLSAGASTDPAFRRRFAGHIEGISPPREKLNFTLSGATLHLSWAASPSLKLQQSPSISPTVWTDVPGTLGASLADLPLTNSAAYFKLAQ